MLAPRIVAICLTGLVATAAPGAHVKPMTADRLAEQLGDEESPVILDVRTEAEYRAGHVPGALHIPHTQLAGRLAEIPAGKRDAVVVYCEQGPRADYAEAILEHAGFSGVRTLAGHMEHWREEGYPTQ